MITYTWKITKLDTQNTDTHTGVVTSVHWEVTGVDGEYSNTQFKIHAIPAPAPDAEFIDFANLTEAQVLEWLFAEMGEYKTFWEDSCRINIEKQKNYVAPAGLPWE